MGKELKNRFIEAGFLDIRATASFDYFSAPADIAFLHAFIGDWFYSADVIAAATKHGLATQEQFDQWRLEHDEWMNHGGRRRGARVRRSHCRQALSPNLAERWADANSATPRARKVPFSPEVRVL